MAVASASFLTAEALAALGGDAAEALQDTAPMDWETVSAASREQIDGIPKAVWNEVRAYARPPDLVRQVAALVQLALGQPVDWATSKKTMKDGSFEQRIR